MLNTKPIRNFNNIQTYNLTNTHDGKIDTKTDAKTDKHIILEPSKQKELENIVFQANNEKQEVKTGGNSVINEFISNKSKPTNYNLSALIE